MRRAWRWLCVLLAMPLAYLVTMLLAFALIAGLERLCPPQDMVSGACQARWYPRAELAAMSLAAALGALLFVVLPWWAAPARRAHVALAAYLLGVAWMGWLLFEVGAPALAPALSAVAAGAVALRIAQRAHR